MLHRVVTAVVTGIFFVSYFDFVTRYEVYKTLGPEAIINPVSLVGEYDSRGIQAIHYAVEIGQFNAVITLIDRFGADVNARTISVPNGDFLVGSTPLIISIIKGNLEIFLYLLSRHNLNLDLSTDELKSALHFAAELGNLFMVEALLAKGAKISYMRHTRKSPFHVAVEAGHIEVAKWLAERNLGLSPVVHILSSKRFESMMHFLARQRLQVTTWIKMFQVISSAMKINESKRPDPIPIIDRKSVCGKVPLQIAVEEGNEVAIIGLIIFGANLYVYGVFDPIIGAIRGFFENNPINPNYQNSINENVWHLCARLNSVILCQFFNELYPTKINLRRSNVMGQTALDLAFEIRNLAVAVELIKMYENSIDIESLERYINISIWNTWPDIIETLMKEFPIEFEALISSEMNPPMFLHSIATYCMRGIPLDDTKRLFLTLIRNYPQLITIHDKSGRTPLHIALQCDFRPFFHWLLEEKQENSELNLNVIDGTGQPFLEMLKEQGDNEILKLFEESK